ncbi:MAG: hypothetical protein PW792_10640 [Acidobacteriaceae bacterium]|nr:hypothetical protein [Acidobacteriaceae bacterium]
MDESRDGQIEKLARGIIGLLLDKNESFEIVIVPGDNETLIRARTMSAMSASKLTGDKGRTAQSIRTIVAAAGTKLGHRYKFEVEGFRS